LSYRGTVVRQRLPKESLAGCGLGAQRCATLAMPMGTQPRPNENAGADPAVPGLRRAKRYLKVFGPRKR